MLETFLAESRAEQSASQISDTLGLNRGRVFRILFTLETQGYVRQDPVTKRYRLGLKLFELGQAVARGFELPSVTAPILAKLTAATGETSYVYALDGLEAVAIAKRECSQPMRISAEIGRRYTMEIGAACNCILAYLSESQIDQVLGKGPLPRMARKTPTDPAAVKHKLAQIRRLGYHLSEEEDQDGISAVAAPIRDANASVIAAVAIAVPTSRFLPEKLPMFISEVQEAARRISEEMGCPPHILQQLAAPDA